MFEESVQWVLSTDTGNPALSTEMRTLTTSGVESGLWDVFDGKGLQSCQERLLRVPEREHTKETVSVNEGRRSNIEA